MRAWLTPDDLTGAAICRPLSIAPQLLPYINGALGELADVWNWEDFGAVSAADTAQYFADLIEQWQGSECETMSYPRSFEWTPEAAYMTVGSIENFIVNANAPLNGWWPTTNIQNTNMRFRVRCEPGTYRVSLLGRKFTSLGISHIKIDGSEIGTFDWYSGGSVQNTYVSFTGIDLTAEIEHTLDILMSTKNAAASGYATNLSLIQLIRTDG